MTSTRLLYGMEILGKYMKDNDIPEREGNHTVVRVLYEELSEEDADKLDKIGWGAIDDWVGFEEDNFFNIMFNKWFDAYYEKTYKDSELDITQEMKFYIETTARFAMAGGVLVGDKKDMVDGAERYLS